MRNTSNRWDASVLKGAEKGEPVTLPKKGSKKKQ